MRWGEFSSKAANIWKSSSHWCIFVEGWGGKYWGHGNWAKAGQRGRVRADYAEKTYTEIKEEGRQIQRGQKKASRVTSLCLQLKALAPLPQNRKRAWLYGWAAEQWSSDFCTCKNISVANAQTSRQEGRLIDNQQGEHMRTLLAPAQWETTVQYMNKK